MPTDLNAILPISKIALYRIGASGGFWAASIGLAVAVPLSAFADSCTPPPPSTTTSPLAISCTSDALPANQSFFYGDGPHNISVSSGNFVDIFSGAGDDLFVATGGAVNSLRGEVGTDRFTVNGGDIRSVVAGPGDDLIVLNNGQSSGAISGDDGFDEIDVKGGSWNIVTGGNDNDTIRLTGGAMNVVSGGDGDDQVFFNGLASVNSAMSGAGGLDRLTLLGLGALDGNYLQFEQLSVASGANWIYRQANDSFSGFLALEPNAIFEIEVGSTLDVGDVLALPASTLKVNGTLAFTPQTSIGGSFRGTLTGDGVINLLGGADPEITSTSIVRPGNSIGTLTFGSGLRIEPGAQLIIEVDPSAPQNADRLAVNGAVTGINGLSIEVETLNAGASAQDYVAANNYVVVTASSIDGNTPKVTKGGGLPSLLDVNIVGTPSTSGQVALAFSEVPISQLPQQPAVTQTGNVNHANLAAAIANAATNNPNATLVSGMTVLQAVATLTNDQAAQLNGLHAEPFSSYHTVSLEDYDMVAGAVLGRLGGSGSSFGGVSTSLNFLAPTKPAGLNTSGVWAAAGYVDGSVDGFGGLGSFGYTIGGVVLGSDLYQDAKVTAGLFGAINRLSFSEHDTVDQDIEGESYHLGAYYRWKANHGLSVSGVFGFALGEHESHRSLPNLGGFTGGTARTEIKTRGVYVGAEVQRSYTMANGVRIIPSAAMVYARAKHDGATETGGGDFNLTLAESSAESLLTSIGWTAQRDISRGRGQWTLIGSAHYHYDWFADEKSVHEISVSNPIFGAFTQVGQNKGAHGFTAALGLSGRISDNVTVGANYGFSWNENGEEHVLGASLSVTW